MSDRGRVGGGWWVGRAYCASVGLFCGLPAPQQRGLEFQFEPADPNSRYDDANDAVTFRNFNRSLHCSIVAFRLVESVDCASEEGQQATL